MHQVKGGKRIRRTTLAPLTGLALAAVALAASALPAAAAAGNRVTNSQYGYTFGPAQELERGLAQQQ